MRRRETRRLWSRGVERAGIIVLAGTLVLGTTACDSLLGVDIPGRVEEEALDDPALATTLLVSALGEFECAYGQYVPTTGILAEEYISSSFWLNTNIWGWRGVEIETADGSCPASRDASGLGFYTPVQRARYMTEDASRRIAAFPDSAVSNKSLMLAQLAAYGAYTYVMLGEAMCEVAIDQGPVMTPQETLEIARQRFTDAIAHAEAAGDDELRFLALTGRARVNLDLGDLQQAAADAAQIPEGFVYYAGYSESRPRRENRVFNMTHRNHFLSVAPAYRGLEVDGVVDPRVPVEFSGGAGQDAVTPHWTQMKFTSASDPIPIASWDEAQLILAEASGGQAARDAINRLRARAGLPLLDGSEGDLTQVILEERRRELFSEGHRLNDMLRHDIAFPTGTNHKGQTYGPVTCIPLPDQETQNNPNA